MKKFCKTSILFFFIFISARIAFPQDTPETRKFETIKKDTTINLFKETEINGSKIVILFKNEDLIVQTSLEVFETTLNKRLKISKYSFDSTLLNIVMYDKPDKPEINVVEMEKHFMVSRRLEYLTADIIEIGKCWIIDKRTGLFYDDVEIQHFDYYRSPSAGYGGRQFLIWRNIFLRVIDYEI